MLTVNNLKVHFHIAAPDRNAVDGISFRVADGEILGLVGESGSGKTVAAMAISGLLRRHECEVSGEILLDGHDILRGSRDELRQLQGTAIGVIFQEPMSSFDPVMKIGHQVEESLKVHKPEMTAEELRTAAIRAMTEAELADPEAVYEKYPHELSGGMLQRAMIAAAIIHEPKLLLADEPTTALDVTIQAQILELLKKINRTKKTSILFISHNLAVVRKLSRRVIVMNRGKIVESGAVEQIFLHPREEYTKRLIESIPARDRHLRGLKTQKEERMKNIAESVKVLIHSSIRVEKGKVLYFDPYHLTEAPHDADVIFITHDHYDHLSPEDIEKVQKDGTRFVLPASCREAARKAGLPQEACLFAEPEKRYEQAGVAFRTIPSYNVNKAFHPKKNGWLGYLVRLEDTTYYVAGDTDDNEDIRRILLGSGAPHIDVALLPVGGTYTMTVEEAARLAGDLRPALAVPMHYGDIVGAADDGKRFVALLPAEVPGCERLLP